MKEKTASRRQRNVSKLLVFLLRFHPPSLTFQSALQLCSGAAALQGGGRSQARACRASGSSERGGMRSVLDRWGFCCCCFRRWRDFRAGHLSLSCGRQEQLSPRLRGAREETSWRERRRADARALFLFSPFFLPFPSELCTRPHSFRFFLFRREKKLKSSTLLKRLLLLFKQQWPSSTRATSSPSSVVTSRASLCSSASVSERERREKRRRKKREKRALTAAACC